MISCIWFIFVADETPAVLGASFSGPAQQQISREDHKQIVNDLNDTIKQLQQDLKMRSEEAQKTQMELRVQIDSMQTRIEQMDKLVKERQQMQLDTIMVCKLSHNLSLYIF